MAEPILSGTNEPRVRRPVLGYAMVLAATCMWGSSWALFPTFRRLGSR